MDGLAVYQSFVGTEGWRETESRPSVFVHGAVYRGDVEVADYSVVWTPGTTEPIRTMIAVVSGRKGIDLRFDCVGITSTLERPTEFIIVDPGSIWVELPGDSVPAHSTYAGHISARKLAVSAALAVFAQDPDVSAYVATGAPVSH